MSLQAITWALTAKTGDPRTKIVLIAIANYADENGHCWPSQRRLSVDTDQSIDTVRRRLSALEKLGLIKREQRDRQDGGRSSDVFVLPMPPLADSYPPLADSQGAPSQASQGPPSTAARAYEPSLNPQLEKKDGARAPLNGNHLGTPELKRFLYDRGKVVLGERAGGVVTKLLKAKGGDVSAAIVALEMASKASTPMDYVHGAIRGRRGERGDDWG